MERPSHSRKQEWIGRPLEIALCVALGFLIILGAVATWRTRSLNNELAQELSHSDPDLDRISHLISEGAAVNTEGGLGTALTLAVLGDEAMVDALLRRGADPNRSVRFPPILGAVGHPPILKKLLERGADPNAHGKVSTSALHRAALMGDEASIRFLLAHGANPNYVGTEGRTAFAAAVDNGYTSIAALLRKAGGK